MNYLRKTGLFCLLMLALSACAAFAQENPADKRLSQEAEKKYDLAFQASIAHFEKADLLFQKEQIDEAIEELEKIIEIVFPEGTEERDGWKLKLDAHSFLGELYLQKGQHEKSIQTLKSGIEIAPEISEQTYDLYMALGHAFKVTKDTDSALDAFDKAQKINETLREMKEKEEKSKSEAEEKN
ncbi:MAG TPA: hypothetical protein PLN69_00085 [bacterium]|nr:hypothetical protein [bacterium]